MFIPSSLYMHGCSCSVSAELLRRTNLTEWFERDSVAAEAQTVSARCAESVETARKIGVSHN